MKKFEESRVTSNQAIVQGLKYEVPTVLIAPKNKTTGKKKMVVFINGYNGSSSMIKFWDYPVFDDVWFFSFDARGQGNNLNIASQNFKRYLKDIHLLLKYLRTQIDFDELYLIGESWGSSLVTLFNKHYPNVVDGILIWNMPYKVIDVENVDYIKQPFLKTKTFITYITKINSHSYTNFNNKLTNNSFLIRVIKVKPKQLISNRIHLATWKSFKRAWRVLFKSIRNNNIYYIQSESDVLSDTKYAKKLLKKSNEKKVFIIPNGSHILSFDKDDASYIFTLLDKIIQKKV